MRGKTLPDLLYDAWLEHNRTLVGNVHPPGWTNPTPEGTYNLVAVGAFSLTGVLPAFLWLPYALQWAETVWGTLNPAVGVKPSPGKTQP